MKWPNYFALIRHGESAYNYLKKSLEADPLWLTFVEEYEKDFESKKSRELAKKLLQLYPNTPNDRGTILTQF